MASMSKKLDIVVVGGSLASLLTSIPLVRLGHNLTILERSPTPLLHDQGAGVVAGGETQAFYSRHDRTKRSIAVTSRQRLYLDKQGEVIDREDTVQRMTSWDLLYFLARANFDQVESDYLEGRTLPARSVGDGTSKYEYGRKVTGVKERGEKVEVTFQDTRLSSGKSNDVGSGDEGGSMQADLVIAADGQSSILRRILLPAAPERTYAGYVAFRGTVLETELSPTAAGVFVERFTFFHAHGSQILAYTIPGSAGSLETGKRLVNWVWYCNYEQSSEEYRDIMTDTDGSTHRFTLPTGGKMRPDILEKQRQRARDTLPPQFAEIVTKTAMPFVQAITDLPPPEEGTRVARLLNGKVILVGDAFSGFRPHTAASTSQAAYHALLLEKVFKGQLSWEDWEEEILEFGWALHKKGVMLGNRSQFGRHPFS